MKRSSGVLAVLVLVAVFALVLWFPGRSGTAPSRVLRAPVSASVGDEGGSWYCAARDVGTDDPSLSHVVFVSAPGDAEATVHLDGFSNDDHMGSKDLTVEPGTTEQLDVGAEFGAAGLSVMAESDAPVIVEHRYSFDGGADQSPCSTFSSDEWYFPQVATTRDAIAHLSLFNPFPGDASVDVELALETGVRRPDELSGIVVPAGTTRVVNLEDFLLRHEQFSATVKTRSGGVVAELAQYFNGSSKDRPIKGLRLVPGSRTASASWSFPGGFADPSASEELVLFNPGEDEAGVLAQLIPFGGVDVMPEPFELSAPARRFVMLPLEKDSRVPAVGYHAIDTEVQDSKAAPGARVVASRAINVTGASDATGVPAARALAKAGTTASPGLSVAAKDWAVGGLVQSDETDGTIFVHNPGRRAVTVSVGARSGGTAGAPVEYALPPGDSVAVDLGELGVSDTPFFAEVHADGAVVVERLLVFTGASDISLQSGVPLLNSLGDLVALEDPA